RTPAGGGPRGGRRRSLPDVDLGVARRLDAGARSTGAGRERGGAQQRGSGPNQGPVAGRDLTNRGRDDHDPVATPMKLTLVGWGVRPPIVLHGLAAREAELGLTEVVLHDVDATRLEVMSALGSHLTRAWGASFSVRREEDPSAALAGARFVFAA